MRCAGDEAGKRAKCSNCATNDVRVLAGRNRLLRPGRLRLPYRRTGQPHDLVDRLLHDLATLCRSELLVLEGPRLTAADLGCLSLDAPQMIEPRAHLRPLGFGSSYACPRRTGVVADGAGLATNSRNTNTKEWQGQAPAQQGPAAGPSAPLRVNSGTAALQQRCSERSRHECRSYQRQRPGRDRRRAEACPPYSNGRRPVGVGTLALQNRDGRFIRRWARRTPARRPRPPEHRTALATGSAPGWRPAAGAGRALPRPRRRPAPAHGARRPGPSAR